MGVIMSNFGYFINPHYHKEPTTHFLVWTNLIYIYNSQPYKIITRNTLGKKQLKP